MEKVLGGLSPPLLDGAMHLAKAVRQLKAKVKMRHKEPPTQKKGKAKNAFVLKTWIRSLPEASCICAETKNSNESEQVSVRQNSQVNADNGGVAGRKIQNGTWCKRKNRKKEEEQNEENNMIIISTLFTAGFDLVK